MTISGESFQQLYESYQLQIYSFFANRGFSREECRDLTQETFLAAFGSRGRFRGRSSLETWIFAIATNIWRSTLRSRKRIKRSAQVVSLEAMGDDDTTSAATLAEEISTESESLEKLLADERIRLLYDALGELPEQMRHCAILRLRQGLKYQEIAEVLKISINTVRSQLFHAREKLRQRLADHFTDLAL